MKREEFLRSLSRKLWWCGSAETKEILDDYREYFETGQAEGKTEEALCDEFGDPAGAAKTLRRMRGMQVKPWIRPAAMTMAVVWTVLYCFTEHHINGEIARLPFLLSVPLLLYAGSCGGERMTEPAGKRPLTGLFAVFSIFCTAAVPFAGKFFYGIRGAAAWWDGGLGRVLQKPLEWGFSAFLCAAAVSAAAACGLALYLWRNMRRTYAAMYVGTGYLAALAEWSAGYDYALPWPDDFPGPYFAGLEQLLLGVVLSLLYLGGIRLCTPERHSPGPPAGRTSGIVLCVLSAAGTGAMLMCGEIWLWTLFVPAVSLLLYVLLHGFVNRENAFTARETRLLLLIDSAAGLCAVIPIGMLLLCLTPEMLGPFTHFSGPFAVSLLDLGSGAVLAGIAVRLFRLPGNGVFSSVAIRAGLLAVMRLLAAAFAALDDPAYIPVLLAASLVPFAAGCACAVLLRKRTERVRKGA